MVTSLCRLWGKGPWRPQSASCVSSFFHVNIPFFCMYHCLWSVILIIICLLEYVQSSQGETQWKAPNKAVLERFSSLIENHHLCVLCAEGHGLCGSHTVLRCSVPFASSWTQFLNLINLQTATLLPLHHLQPCKCVVLHVCLHLLFDLFVFLCSF